MKYTIALLACLFTATASAGTVLIDFDDFPNGPSDGLTLSSKGFQFASEAVFIVSGTPSTSDQSLQYCPFCTTTMVNDDGLLFDLNAFDFSNVFGFAGTVEVTGTYGAGGTVSTTLNIDGSKNNYVFDSSWTDLSNVVFATPTGAGGNYVGSIDNISINVVPIPAAVWLFGSALAGLGWLQRRAGDK